MYICMSMYLQVVSIIRLMLVITIYKLLPAVILNLKMQATIFLAIFLPSQSNNFLRIALQPLYFRRNIYILKPL